MIEAGSELPTIDSNESESYSVRAPASGIVSRIYAAAGEQSAGRTLLTLPDNRTLQAELAVYPKDWSRVKPVPRHHHGTRHRITGSGCA